MRRGLLACCKAREKCTLQHLKYTFPFDLAHVKFYKVTLNYHAHFIESEAANEELLLEHWNNLNFFFLNLFH